MTTRRSFLGALAGAAGATVLPRLAGAAGQRPARAAAATVSVPPAELASDEAFWFDLRWLRARWEDRLHGRERVTLRTSRDPRLSCGIGNFHIDGIDPGKLAAHLRDRRRILVTPIGHEEVPGIRVTPSVYTTAGEIDRFSEAIEEVLAGGLPA